MRNASAYVSKAQHQMVAAAIRTVFIQADHAIASVIWRQVADQLRGRLPKLAALMDEAEADVIAFVASPKSHWPKLHSTHPIERLNKEAKRRADVVGIFPDEAPIPAPCGVPSPVDQHQRRAARHPRGALAEDLKSRRTVHRVPSTAHLDAVE